MQTDLGTALQQYADTQSAQRETAQPGLDNFCTELEQKLAEVHEKQHNENLAAQDATRLALQQKEVCETGAVERRTAELRENTLSLLVHTVVDGTTASVQQMYTLAVAQEGLN